MECYFCSLAENSDPEITKIFETETTVAFVSFFQVYSGQCLLLVRKHYVNMFDIDVPEHTKVMGDLRILSAAIDKAFKPDKTNYMLLGNSESHCHWHIVPRYKSDKDWGRSPTFSPNDVRESDEVLLAIAEKIKQQVVL